MAKLCTKLTERIRGGVFGSKEIDPDDKLIEVYDRALDALGQINDHVLKPSLNEVRGDYRLIGQHRDHVLEAYRSCREALVDLFECMDELKTAIMEHDAEVSGVAGSYGSVQELMASISGK